MKQQGIVLFFAIIVLLIMTVIGVALATNSSLVLQVANSSGEKIEALANINGAQEKFLDENDGEAIMTNLVAGQTITDAVMNVEHLVSPVNVEDLPCKRSSNANASKSISCRRVEVRTESKYGKKDMGTLVITSGFEQQVLTGS